MKLHNEYDVIVVGAGPGGSVTARFAAENGASVLMLERDREPGIPVRCAEGVSSGKLDSFIDIDKRWIANEISGARLYTPDGNHLEMRSSVNGYILERRIFDTALCELASEKGAVMLTKANVTGADRVEDNLIKVSYEYRGKTDHIFCKILIGADGIESRVGRWLGLKTKLELNDISTSVQYTLTNLKIQHDILQFHFGNNVAPGGYAWVFPKSETTANVGLGITGNFAHAKGPKNYLDDFVEKHFPQSSVSYTVYSGIPVAATLKDIVTDNVMLVGDAARQVNPITGGGIKQAMVAGKIAGTLAAEAVKKNNFSKKFLQSYAQEWDKTLGSKHRFMHKVKEKILHASDERLNKLSYMCKDIPPDQISLPELFKKVVKGDPMMVAEMAKAFVLSKIDL
jgi:digeranylgeranylglycerophospholipid reductase